MLLIGSALVFLSLIATAIILFLFCFSVFAWFACFRRRKGNDSLRPVQMDYQYITFSNFLWCGFFILPHAFTKAMLGSIALKLKLLLHARGYWPVEGHEPAKVVAQLLLNTALNRCFSHFRGQEPQPIFATHLQETSPPNAIAVFDFPKLVLLDAEGKKRIAELQVEVLLVQNLMFKATLDGQEISAQDAMIILYYSLVTYTHVKLHTLANLGVNVTLKQSYTLWPVWNVLDFQHRNAVCTILYNWLGYTTFSIVYNKILYRLGLVQNDVGEFLKIVDHSIADGELQAVGPWVQLLNHSRLVRFLIPLREHFLESFKEHEKDFPAIDPDAMFVGTVCHSIDHTVSDNIIRNPLWLFPDSPEYHRMAEQARIIRAGFAADLEGLLFVKSFRCSTELFFKQVYEHAREIDPYLADHMDTCIIK